LGQLQYVCFIISTLFHSTLGQRPDRHLLPVPEIYTVDRVGLHSQLSFLLELEFYVIGTISKIIKLSLIVFAGKKALHGGEEDRAL
jgi:hypothetical protein